MPRYRVTVTRDTSESTSVEVEVASKDLADDAALQYAIDHPTELIYEPDDGNFSEPYIPAPGEAEEVRFNPPAVFRIHFSDTTDEDAIVAVLDQLRSTLAGAEADGIVAEVIEQDN